MSYNKTRTYSSDYEMGYTHGMRDAKNYTWKVSPARAGLDPDGPEWTMYLDGYRKAHLDKRNQAVDTEKAPEQGP